MDTVAAAPRTGADLRAARERLGWSLPDVAEALRIRVRQLEALEDGDLDRLPGNAFAMAFLRSYSTQLGLDPDEMVRRFKAEAAEVARRTELVFPVAIPERGLPTGATVLLGLIVAVGAYIGWYKLSGEGKLPAETAIVAPERMPSVAEQALPDTRDPMAAMAARPTMPTEPAPVADPAPMATIGPDPSKTVAAPTAPVQPAPAVATAPTAVPVKPAAPTASPAPTAAVPAPASRVVVRATGQAWVRVRDATGNVLFQKVMNEGETWAVPDQPGLLLNTGNAQATQLVVDGATMTIPSTSALVRNDVVLDIEKLKTGKVAVVPARTAQ